MRLISPSLMCLDREDELAIQFLCEKADFIHFDIMDKDFSSCVGLTPQLIERLHKNFNPKFDVHIMSKFPLQHIKYCISNNCEIISFHVESEVDINFALDLIHQAGLKAGLAIKPNTTINALYPYLSKLDLINVMLVEPGPAGQKFQKRELSKVIELNQLKKQNNYKYLIEVDGSCNKKHYHSIDSAEPDICVVGTSGLFSINHDLALAWQEMEQYMSRKTIIYLHADLVGNVLKEAVKEWLLAQGYNVIDFYTDGEMEYPECARMLCENIVDDDYKIGLLFCGTGLGMSMAANKVQGIRAAVVSDVYSAKMSREHNDANVLCLGSRVVAKEYGILIVKEFLKSVFLFGKHTPRVERLD